MGVAVLVGTRKGAFILTSDGKRQKWDVNGPHFSGWEIYHMKGSPVDPNRIYVSGHSSGGHLAGVVLTTDWSRDFNLPADAVKGGLCSSGMFDLKPVCLSARRRYLACTAEMEEALSSQRRLDRLNAPVIVTYGTLETPEFQRQSRDFADALTRAGKSCEIIRAEGYNHFEIAETLGNPYGPAGRALLAQMKLNPY